MDQSPPNSDAPQHQPSTQAPLPPTSGENKYKKPFYVLLSVLLLALTAFGIYWLLKPAAKTPASSVSSSAPISRQQTASSNIQGLQLDASKNYGDKYANGILPVGDGKYVTDTAKSGFVYACSGYASNMQASQGGAGRRGPWFVGTTQYDLNKKIHVQGSVMWQADFTNKVSGSTRTIITNDLPSHPTGTFPISATDPAYAYDRNPNTIKGQTFTYNLNSSPTYGDPTCIGGQVGVMLTGVALFSGFDAAGRDAGAWEIQDSCSGHPQSEGVYHYHTLSSCIKDVNVKTVIGFALDGFPITGPQVGTNNILTSSDLDECHGLRSQIVLDGKNITTYHYVMTQDFPYSVSCYHATAIQPPGQAAQPNGKP